MIATTSTKITYQGNGLTTEFAIPFAYIEAGQIKVIITDPEDIETELETDYFVDTDKNVVIYPGYPPGQEPAQTEQPEILPEGWKLTIYRATEATQLEDIGDKYPLPVIEKMVDKITQLIQELKEGVERSVKVDISADITPDKLLDEIYDKTAIAQSSAAAAAASENNAKASENNAKASEQAAAQSETNAESYKDTTYGYMTTTEAYVTQAGQSATTATNKATEASASANAAAQSKTAAEAAESIATQKATSAAASATSASASATSAANSAELASTFAHRLPVGTIFAYAGNSGNPIGALLCDGSAVSRTMYPDLFEKIGTTYGAGDGATTFNLPNLSDNRFVEGSTTAGTAKSAGLPNITGNYRVHGDQNSGFWYENISGACSGLAANGKSVGTSNYSADGLYYGFSFDASRSSSVYGNSATVQPKSLTLRFFIQAFDGQTPDSALIDITQYAQALAGKLPLSGGTMTGVIRMSATSGIYSAVNNSYIFLNGGTTGQPTADHFNGAHLALFGKDSPAPSAGTVWLAADNGSQKCGLSLTPSGAASWKGIPLEGLGMPSTTVIALNVPKDTSWVQRTYTAATDGYVRANISSQGIVYSVFQGYMQIQGNSSYTQNVFMPVNKGTYTIVCYTTDWTNKSATWSFVPTRGAL